MFLSPRKLNSLKSPTISAPSASYGQGYNVKTSWISNCVPIGYWNLVEHHKEFFLSYVCKENLNTMKDWHNVSLKSIYDFGGSAFLVKYYKGSLYQTLQTLFPNVWWKPWLFKRTPKGYWKEPKNQKAF